MPERAFQQIDVFSQRPGDGNPLAVVLDAQGLSDADMQRFATWANLSETTYLLPPTEAGLAAARPHAARARPGGTRVCAGSGANRTPGRHPGLCCTAIAAQQAQPGPGAAGGQRARVAPSPNPSRRNCWTTAPCGWACCWTALNTVLGLTPDHARLKDLGQDVGVIHIAPDAGDNPERPGAVVRAFAAPMGNPEDPVTGSLNASLAQWLIAEGLAPTRYLVAQGECLGRAGRVYIRQDAQGQVWVGGHTVTCIEGTALL
jgi:predicted PhzF superfamily epimerase YddE/YHI9